MAAAKAWLMSKDLKPLKQNKKTKKQQHQKKTFWIDFFIRKNTDTEQNEKQQTLNVFSQGFGINASGLENKRDIIRFLLTFICENTFLPPAAAAAGPELLKIIFSDVWRGISPLQCGVGPLRLASHCE